MGGNLSLATTNTQFERISGHFWSNILYFKYMHFNIQRKCSPASRFKSSMDGRHTLQFVKIWVGGSVDISLDRPCGATIQQLINLRMTVAE